jgi:homocysteine S-methyltransferase
MRDPGPLRPFLETGICVLDGGLATELERRGADLRSDLWSATMLLESPGSIVEAHRAYFEAGADVAITASYQASEIGFAARGIDRAGTEILLRRSVELARAARDAWLDSAASESIVRPRPLVAASVGPYGAVLADGSEYRGDYGRSRAELVEFHMPRLEVLAEAEPDLLAIETIPASVEADAIVETLSRLGDPVPAWCSFTMRDGEHLADGSPLDASVAAVQDSPSVVAIGVNCSPPTIALGAVARIVTIADVAVVAYPNRGADWDAERKAWTGGLDVDMGSVAAALEDAGAGVIGGCCGIGPADVRAIATQVGARRAGAEG